MSDATTEQAQDAKRAGATNLAKGLHGMLLTLEGGTDGEHNLVDLHTRRETVGLTVGTTHTCRVLASVQEQPASLYKVFHIFEMSPTLKLTVADAVPERH